MKTKKWIAIGPALFAAACMGPGGGGGTPYTPRGNPWAATTTPAAMAAAAEPTRKPAEEKPADARTEAGSDAAPASGNGTVLEQLETARARAAKAEAENQKLKTDNASLTAVVDQLKKENQGLAQAADVGAEGRKGIEQEMEQLRQKLKDSDSRARALADEVLQERILRVRVERELILAKVQEAENAAGGN